MKMTLTMAAGASKIPSGTPVQSQRLTTQRAGPSGAPVSFSVGTQSSPKKGKISLVRDLQYKSGREERTVLPFQRSCSKPPPYL
jgi:hypothetical protein